MNKEKKELWGKIAIFGGLALITLGGIIYNKWLRTLPQDYTVGTVVDIWKPAKGGKLVGFKYHVNNKEYENDVKLHGYDGVAKPGKRFLVEYPEEHIGSGFMHLDKPVPDSIEPPPQGWDEIPEFLK